MKPVEHNFGPNDAVRETIVRDLMGTKSDGFDLYVETDVIDEFLVDTILYEFELTFHSW